MSPSRLDIGPTNWRGPTSLPFIATVQQSPSTACHAHGVAGRLEEALAAAAAAVSARPAHAGSRLQRARTLGLLADQAESGDGGAEAEAGVEAEVKVVGALEGGATELAERPVRGG